MRRSLSITGLGLSMSAILAANTKLLGIVKRKRKAAHPLPLELIPILTTSGNP
jgi:hypothetical protein